MTDTSASPGPSSAQSRDYFAGDPRSNYERMKAGDFYISDDPKIFEEQQRAARLSAMFLAAYSEDGVTAQEIARELFGGCGEAASVRPPIYVDYGSHITVGARAFINAGFTALDVARISIGADCQIGPQVQLLTAIHPVEPQRRRDKLEAAKPITIGDNVWLGGGAIILPGVTIGENSVIGAGTVVTKDIPTNCVAVGNPARVIKSI